VTGFKDVKKGGEMGLLLMVMSIGGVIIAVFLLLTAYLSDSVWLRKFILGCVAIWFGFYFLMLIGFSLVSTEKTLPIGEAKEYCGFYLDCHMHTAVTEVRTARSIGNRTADGEFYIVTVKVFSNAKQATLGLLNVTAKVLDEDGSKYYRDLDAEDQVPPQPRFEKQISPVESFEKQIVFDLPVDAKNPRLDLKEGYKIDRAIEALVIGDEDSLLHKRNYFQLSDKTQTVAAK
jgi:hypothetical protein